MRRRKFEKGISTVCKIGLDHCTVKLKKSGVEGKIISRRKALAAELRQNHLQKEHGEKYLQVRQLSASPSKNHESNASFTLETPNWMIFGDKAAVLSPKVYEGPYYVTGDQIRKDVRDNQKGIKMYLDLQFMDMTTCEPAKNIAIDFWSCNSTGSYGGTEATSTFLGKDPLNLKNMMLRGTQFVDENGVAQFISNFPGHYTGRTNHAHLMTYVNPTRHPNNTISGGNVAQIAQLYFDQDLIDTVEKTHPYNTNREMKMRNDMDFLIATGSMNGQDPPAEYVMLGPKIEDGILAWLNFGIDPKVSYKTYPASHCYKEGCVNNPMGGFAGLMAGLMEGLPGFGVFGTPPNAGKSRAGEQINGESKSEAQ